MTQNFRRTGIAAFAIAALFATAAQAQMIGNNAANYNNPYGMSQAQENAPADASLRDANGNLTVVNGVSPARQ